VACDWTSITIRTGAHPIDVKAFENEPFLTGDSPWRCRPEQRGADKDPFYRKVIGLPGTSLLHCVPLIFAH